MSKVIKGGTVVTADRQIKADVLIEGETIVEIGENPHIDVPLYWHHWTLASDKLSRLTEALRRAAAFMR